MMSKKISLFDSVEYLIFCENNTLENSNDKEDYYNVKRSRLKKIMLDCIQNELTPKQREYIKLYYFEEKSVGEIAKLLGITSSTVSITLSRARKKLHHFLKYAL